MYTLCKVELVTISEDHAGSHKLSCLGDHNVIEVIEAKWALINGTLEYKTLLPYQKHLFQSLNSYPKIFMDIATECNNKKTCDVNIPRVAVSASSYCAVQLYYECVDDRFIDRAKIVIPEHDKISRTVFCPDQQSLRFTAAKWSLIDTRVQLHKDVNKRFREMTGEDNAQILTEIQQSYNHNQYCEFADLRSGLVKSTAFLKLELYYTCVVNQGAGQCPNEKFVLKHIAPLQVNNINGQLSIHAADIKILREAYDWKPSDTQTLFTGASDMKYIRGSNNACIFEKQANKYRCEFSENLWTCTNEGPQKASHDTVTGHYDSTDD